MHRLPRRIHFMQLISNLPQIKIYRISHLLFSDLILTSETKKERTIVVINYYYWTLPSFFTQKCLLFICFLMFYEFISSPSYVNLYFQSNSWERARPQTSTSEPKPASKAKRDRSPDTRGQYCSTDSRADGHFSEKLMTGTVCNKNFHLIAEITDYN